MIKKYESKAKETGAILIPPSGLESAPADIRTWALCQLIQSKLSAQTTDVVIDILKMVPNLGLLQTSYTAVANATVVQRTWGIFKQSPARHKEF
ncbi:putative Saccharopine dehydrogenase-domain-containing protein [Seiridium cardinale]|uniref:Saccharopine dehydrogenase-domain-containing protein n=1 Tax=Seiridium cardinale TaxID=138064 RepID=A0ABR2XFP1_9PEZI